MVAAAAAVGANEAILCVDRERRAGVPCAAASTARTGAGRARSGSPPAGRRAVALRDRRGVRARPLARRWRRHARDGAAAAVRAGCRRAPDARRQRRDAGPARPDRPLRPGVVARPRHARGPGHASSRRSSTGSTAGGSTSWPTARGWAAFLEHAGVRARRPRGARRRLLRDLAPARCGSFGAAEPERSRPGRRLARLWCHRRAPGRRSCPLAELARVARVAGRRVGGPVRTMRPRPAGHRRRGARRSWTGIAPTRRGATSPAGCPWSSGRGACKLPDGVVRFVSERAATSSATHLEQHR